jgi:hypothetical protein
LSISVEAVRLFVCCMAGLVFLFSIAALILSSPIAKSVGRGVASRTPIHDSQPSIPRPSRAFTYVRAFLLTVGIFGVIFAGAIVYVGFSTT